VEYFAGFLIDWCLFFIWNLSDICVSFLAAVFL